MATNGLPGADQFGSAVSDEQRGMWFYVRALRQKYPGLWESLSEKARAKILSMAKASAKDGSGFPKFRNAVRELQAFKAWQGEAEQPTGGDGEPTEGGGGEDGDPTDPETPTEEEDPIDQNVLDILAGFLRDNGLPASLLGFIQSGLAEKKGYNQIIAELRQTEEYKAAYPENAIRVENGLSWMPEAQIRGMRDEIKRLANEYLGTTSITQEELNNVIGKGWSLPTWEKKLQRFQEFERWGPTVKGVLESQLGYSLDDERLYAFFDDTPTPELDQAYEKALMMGQPALLGLGVRPEEEADLLRRYGISPEQAFSGYQNLAKELPRSNRLGLIEGEIGRNLESFPAGNQLFNDTPFATLFRAIQLQDPEAIQKLQAQMAREVARFQGQGGAAQDQGGASIGLLSEEERQRL